MRNRLLGILVLMFVLVIALWLRQPAASEFAFIGQRTVTAWNRNAQVRQPVATLRFGERVEVRERNADRVRIRTEDGTEGWIEASDLMLPEVWERGRAFVRETSEMPAQATGHTRATANVRLDSGRDAERVFQLPRDVPVEILGRALRDPSAKPAGPGDAPDAESMQLEATPGRPEEWWLVRGNYSEPASVAIPVAGWVYGPLVEFDVPEPLREYAGAIRYSAWFPMGQVSGASEEKTRYLAAGSRPGDSALCGFTLLRYYTWSRLRSRYETAYREDGLCGKLPIFAAAPEGQNPGGFHFESVSPQGSERVRYTVRGNIVGKERSSAPPR